LSLLSFCFTETTNLIEANNAWVGTRYVPAFYFSCYYLDFDKDLISAIVSTTMVIRMRHTRSHTANRRSHHALKAPTLAVCKNCEANHRPHHMCLGCGYYNGRQVIDLEAKKTAREARMNAKREAIKGSAVGG